MVLLEFHRIHCLLTVALLKFHLTLHSRMSDPGWLISPSQQSGSLRPFLYSSSVYFHLILISPVSTRSPPFLSFIGPIFGAPWCFQFSWRALQSFPFCCSVVKHCSLKKVFFSLLTIFWNSAFKWMYLSLSPLLFASLHSSTICKASSDNHFALLLFFFFGMVLFGCMAWFITSLSYASPFATTRQWSMKGIPNILIFSNGFGVGLFLALVLETQRVFSS